MGIRINKKNDATRQNSLATPLQSGVKFALAKDCCILADKSKGSDRWFFIDGGCGEIFTVIAVSYAFSLCCLLT